jgi:hypothetical protein
MLDGILGNQTDLQVTEHAAGTHGADLANSALFDLVGLQLPPHPRPRQDHSFSVVKLNVGLKRVGLGSPGGLAGDVALLLRLLGGAATFGDCGGEGDECSGEGQDVAGSSGQVQPGVHDRSPHLFIAGRPAPFGGASRLGPVMAGRTECG